jgi:hypothetical protein
MHHAPGSATLTVRYILRASPCATSSGFRKAVCGDDGLPWNCIKGLHTEPLLFGPARRIPICGLIASISSEISTEDLDELARLADLKAHGAISEAEYEHAKERILH